MTSVLLNSTAKLFGRISLSLASGCFCIIGLRLHILDKNTTEGMPCSVSLKGHRVSIGLITGDGSTGHLDEVVSANFFHYEVKLFLFEINK